MKEGRSRTFDNYTSHAKMQTAFLKKFKDKTNFIGKKGLL
jgi:hypothetical protein